MKKTVNIGELLYFDEDKFKRHVSKRKEEGIISDSDDYIDIIRDVINNHERLLITEDKYQEKFLLLKKGEWILIFNRGYRIYTCFLLTDFDTIEGLLDFYIESNKIINYMEVKDENSSYKRIISEVQKRT